MGARFWLEISLLFFPKVINVEKKVKNSLKNAKKMKKIAEKLPSNLWLSLLPNSA